MKFHHLEMCAKNGPRMVQFFTEKMDFQLTASRRKPAISSSTNEDQRQWVVSNQSAPIVITEKVNSSVHVPAKTSNAVMISDSVFDVSLQVDDVQRLTENMQAAGVKVLVEPTQMMDENGSVIHSTVHTGFGNIVHTLLEKKSYRGSFLPGWKSNSTGTREGDIVDGCRKSSPTISGHASTTLTGNVDHLTYACMPGEMDDILEWYRRWFGMERLIMNEMDDVHEGLIIGGTIGIRLKAAKAAHSQDPNRPFFLVLVEPLTVKDGNHVSVFLEKHGGPGVEHVAFTTKDIVQTVTAFRNQGLQFRDAPQDETLTKQIETEANIHLRKLGILLDKEEGDRYLYQAFTLPIFEEPTLFLELIQRKGAQAFGAGNITRIMKSIERR